uniref:Uncharacterized protein n=1 Tax=Anopheles albimanus TaxID=7167 RepID=A0A182FHW5_ANOAL
MYARTCSIGTIIVEDGEDLPPTAPPSSTGGGCSEVLAIASGFVLNPFSSVVAICGMASQVSPASAFPFDTRLIAPVVMPAMVAKSR